MPDIVPTGAPGDTLRAGADGILRPALAVAVRVGAGVPSGAPTTAEAPFAYDTTAVSGGFYFWNGAAWVKVANIL